MKTTALTIATLGLLLSSSPAQTLAVPPFINYQSVVTDTNGVGLGNAAPENRKILFRIYDAPTAGTKIWAEEQTVTISKGEFSVLLGNGIDAPSPDNNLHPDLSTVFSGGDRYIGITVDNGNGNLNDDTEITPRARITSTAFAFRAKSADSIASGTDLQLNGSTNYGLGWYGTGRPFNGTPINGPVLYGVDGGALGSVNGATQVNALRWNATGQVSIGSANPAGAAATTKLLLQGDDATSPPAQLTIRGNADTNKRLLIGYNTTNNYGALQAYSAASTATNLVLNEIGGNVGIGIANPGAFKLNVNGAVNTGALTATSLSGNGSGLTNLTSNQIPNLDASKITTGTLRNNGGAFSLGGLIEVRAGDSDRFGMTVSGDPATVIYHSGTNANSSIQFGKMTGASSFTQQMVINSSGNVSMGPFNAPSPTATLHVNRNGTGALPATSGTSQSAGHILRLGEASNAKLDFGGNSANGYWIQCTDQLNLATNYPLLLNPNGGNVGIGTGTTYPSQARLVVNGGVNSAIPAPFRQYYNNGVGIGSVASSSLCSIWASNTVNAGEFNAFSDARIKHVEGRSDAARDLATLSSIEVADYSYVDTIGKGTTKHKKVIAQQVEKVFPQAVSKSTDVVPDIYQKATVKDGWVKLATNLKKGERVRLMSEKEEGIHEVLEVKAEGFRTAFSPKGDKVFVYGREVNDFRSVDYEAIAMLNVSATQELARKVTTLEKQNAEKDQALTALKKRLADLEARDKAREARLIAIEQRLSNDAPSARTVSLKKSPGKSPNKGDGAE